MRRPSRRRILSPATIVLFLWSIPAISEPIHDLVRSLSCTDAVDCSGLSTGDCLDAVCKSCGADFPIIEQCCSAADGNAKIQCLQQGLQNGGNPLITSPPSTPTLSASVALMSVTSSSSLPSSSSEDPCSQVSDSIYYCNLATPGFADIANFSVKASCLCYRYQTYDPTPFDEPFAACATESFADQFHISETMVANATQAVPASPCSLYGPVMGTSPGVTGGAAVTVVVAASNGARSGMNPRLVDWRFQVAWTCMVVLFAVLM